LLRICSSAILPASAPNTKRVADITGIGTAEGWFYLAAIVDISSRLVGGWAMSKERDEQLVTKAAQMAITEREARSQARASLRERKSVDEPGLSRTASRNWKTSQYEQKG